MEVVLEINDFSILQMLKSELEKLEIDFLVKEAAPNMYPVNDGSKSWLVLAAKENAPLINDIYDNLKTSRQKEPEAKTEASPQDLNKILTTIAFIIILFCLTLTIIFQQKDIRQLETLFTSYDLKYVYERSKDYTELKTYTKDKAKLLARAIDKDKNGIFEIVEEYYPDGFFSVCEDKNQNYFFEKISFYKNSELISESLSSQDDGLMDEELFYENSRPVKKIVFDRKNKHEIIDYEK